MNKIFLIPAIILLTCCVTVGAFNLVSNSNNRPLTFYETLETISNFDFSFENIYILLENISDAWDFGTSTYPHEGGPPSDNFGDKNYDADTGYEWLDIFLEGFSALCYSVIALFKIFSLILYDSLSLIYSLFDIISKMVLGVPR